MSGVIYKMTFQNGKIYVGQTCVGFEKRMTQHRRFASFDNPKLAVHRAWKKHGAPQCCVIAIVEKYELSNTEVRAISAFNSFGNAGYNLTPGGETSPMKVPATVEKVRALAKTPERIARNLAVHLGSKRTPECRLEMSKKRKGQRKGVALSKEHRARIGEKTKGNKNFLGRSHSKETILKMSESAKRRWATVLQKDRSGVAHAVAKANTNRQWSQLSRARLSVSNATRFCIKDGRQFSYIGDAP